MKKYSLIIFILLIAVSCRKRNDRFSFAGVWEIQKVEQVGFVNDTSIFDRTFKSDTLGWFALQNLEGLTFYGKIQINFTSLSGLTTQYDSQWEIDEHNADRLVINGVTYTRARIYGGEKWTWVSMANSGATYTRETIYVKHK